MPGGRVDGQASISLPPPTLSAGRHTVNADFATLPDGDDTGSLDSPAILFVLAAPAVDPPATPTQPSTLDPSQVGIQGPVLGDAGARMQTGSNAFNGVPNVDPFTGAPAIEIDPYTGEPLSGRDASISERIRAIYRQPDAVPESTRYAILDSYFHPIDFTGVPQSVQNSIFEVFSHPEPPLPGLGLDEYVANLIPSALSSIFADTQSAFRTAWGVASWARDEFDSAYDEAAIMYSGAKRAIGGNFEVGIGVAMAVGSGGVLAGLGAVLAAHGLDEVIAGARIMSGEKNVQSFYETSITLSLKPFMGPDVTTFASGVNAVTPLALGFAPALLPEVAGEVGAVGLRGASMEAAGLSESAAARIEASGTTAAARAELSELTAAARIEVSGTTAAAQLGEVKPMFAPAAEMSTELAIPRSQFSAGNTEWSAARIEQSFEGVIDPAEFENNPAVIDRLDRARQFDIGGYDQLKARGPGEASERVGRVGDNLDSDEALQNAYIRIIKDVDRNSAIASKNPAMALSPENHRSIKINLKTPQMQGLSPEQVLEFHLRQMEVFAPDFAIRMLEREVQRYIAVTF